MATPAAKYRIKSDIKFFMKDPPHGISGVPDEHDMTKFHAIITGPDDTPYEKGFFYFHVHFPENYPHSPPSVRFMTTGGGSVRLHPNLYANGKVCLSILGTWVGPAWTSAQSLSSVLISIQSLLDAYPYHNEPGHEKEKEPGAAVQYNEIIRHETMRVAVVGMVRNDAAISLPISLEFHIQEQFLKNIEFYECLATQKAALSGNLIVDPLYGSSAVSYLQYDEILKSLKDLKEQLGGNIV